MRALLASILVVFTAAPFTFVIPLAAETVKTSFLSEIHQRRLISFLSMAIAQCKVEEFLLREDHAVEIFGELVDKNDYDFFTEENNIETLNNFIKLIIEESDDCSAGEYLQENAELLQEIIELIKK